MNKFSSSNKHISCQFVKNKNKLYFINKKLTKSFIHNFSTILKQIIDYLFYKNKKSYKYDLLIIIYFFKFFSQIILFFYSFKYFFKNFLMIISIILKTKLNFTKVFLQENFFFLLQRKKLFNHRKFFIIYFFYFKNKIKFY